MFQNNYVNLVKVLPMKDDIFMAELFKHKLLPDTLKETLDVIPVSTTRATKFLDNVIKPAVSTDNIGIFDALLEIMKNCDYEAVKKLAESISSELSRESGTNKAGEVILEITLFHNSIILKIKWIPAVTITCILQASPQVRNIIPLAQMHVFIVRYSYAYVKSAMDVNKHKQSNLLTVLYFKPLTHFNNLYVCHVPATCNVALTSEHLQVRAQNG